MGRAVDLLFQTNNDCFLVAIYLHSCKDEEQFAENVAICAYSGSGNFRVVKINLRVLLFRVGTFRGLGQFSFLFFHGIKIKYGSYLGHVRQETNSLLHSWLVKRYRGMTRTVAVKTL